MDKRVNLLESERDACIPSSRQFGVAICDGADEQCKPPTTRPNALSQRVQDIVEEKYGTFFNGMTPTAVELYKVSFNKKTCKSKIRLFCCLPRNNMCNREVVGSSAFVALAHLPLLDAIFLQYMIDNVASWGLVDDPIGTFLCQAAFYIVEHPSPRTKAELNAVAGCDLRGKVTMEIGICRGGHVSVGIEKLAKSIPGRWKINVMSRPTPFDFLLKSGLM